MINFKKFTYLSFLFILFFTACEDHNISSEQTSQLNEESISDSKHLDELVLQRTTSDVSGGVTLSLGIIRPLDSSGRIQRSTTGTSYIRWRVIALRQSTDASVSIDFQFAIITSLGLKRLHISSRITTLSFPAGKKELVVEGIISAKPNDFRNGDNICLEVKDFINGGATSILSRECKPTIPYSANCSCSDDAAIVSISYVALNPTQSRFDICWEEMPSGYPVVELGYTANNGSIVVIKDDFGLCESKCGQFIAPSPTLNEGPNKFWIRTMTIDGYGRGCNGFYYIN